MSRPSSSPSNQPRLNRPRPPSTRPPSSADAARDQSHEVFVQIANLQMAKARQKRIRAALQGQVDTCTQEIERINQKIAALYDEAGIEPADDEADGPTPSGREDGFEYEY
jgi:uncharacterized protein (DUF305 family)